VSHNPTVVHRRFTLVSRLGEPIRGDLRRPEGPGPHPVVVACHGFKGFKDWGFHPWLGEHLADAGLAAVHFDFSRNGVKEAGSGTRSRSSGTTSTRSSMPSFRESSTRRSTRRASASSGTAAAAASPSSAPRRGRR